MFKFDPKTNDITMTMTITWDNTVSRCWHYYHNVCDEEYNDKILHGIENETPFPDFDKLTAEEKLAIMQAVAEELDYQEPEGWSGILNVVDKAVREYIDDSYELDDDALSDCEYWADYLDRTENPLL